MYVLYNSTLLILYEVHDAYFVYYVMLLSYRGPCFHLLYPCALYGLVDGIVGTPYIFHYALTQRETGLG